MVPNNRSEHRGTKRHAPRRSVLLASAAGIGLALVAGPGAYNHFSTWTAPAQAAEAAQSAPSFADLVAKVKPAVISVRVQMDENASKTTLGLNGQNGNQDQDSLQPGSPFDRFFRQFQFRGMPGEQEVQPPRMITGVGSGFFISGDGYAVTNYHVVDHATNVQVTTDDGTIYKAKVVGTDPKTDVALIKVEGNQDFPFVKFADHAPRIGDWVVAVGNPFGLGGTVTAGIVSAQGRDIGSGPYDDYIQIDAPINKGNSGGPAFDANGDVIGINTAIFSPSGGSVGIGFDIPASTAKMVIAQLKSQGHVTRGWMGVQIQSITPEIADGLGMKEIRGALVDQPQNGSPAAKAGLKAGDVITQLNGTAVRDAHDLARRVAMVAPGTSVNLDIKRDGQEKTLTLTLAAMPDQQRANADSTTQTPSGVPDLGLTLAPANQVAGSTGNGLVVEGVEPNGIAADHGLKTGDVILDVGGKSVANVGDVRKALADAKSQGKHDVLMRVKTADSTHYVALPIATS
jgi:serine protease Do